MTQLPNTDIQMSDDIPEPNKKMVIGSQTAQNIIFVNGLVLTIIIVTFLIVFTREFINDEQNYIADYSVQGFLNNADRLTSVMGNVALIAEVSSDISQFEVNFKKLEMQENYFNAFIFAKFVNGSGWQYRNFTLGVENINSLFQKLQKDNALISRSQEYAKAHSLDPGRVFFLELPNTNPDYEGSSLYFLVRRIGSESQPLYAFGLLSDFEAFKKPFVGSNKYLSSIQIQNKLTPDNSMFWNMGEGAKGHSDDSAQYEKSFLLDIWQSPMELTLEYNAQHKLFFFSSLPYYFGFIGLVLTIVATLYVRNSKSQALKFSDMNDKLENKNSELRNEIAERERLNTVLRQSERENRAIIDAVSDIIFETNIEGEIIFLSASWRKVTGLDPEQSIGLELFSLLHPQDQKQQHRDFDLLIKGQRQAYRSFARLRTADGTFRAVEIAMSMIRQDQNKNLRVVGTFTDVEERRRAERALSEAEKKYRTIVENAAGGIYQLTPEGIYLSANPAMARILGYDAPEQILREVKNAYTNIYDNEKDHAEVFKALSGNVDFYNHETQMIRKNGQKIWVNENIRAVKDESGNILYFEGSVEDIEQRKAFEIGLMEAKMQSDLANRAKSEFLTNMSHELRTPLNSIIGFSEIMKNEVFGKIEQPSYLEYAKHINDSGQSLLRVINEILDISRIEAGDRMLNESLVNIENVVDDCLELLSSKIENNQMNIITLLKEIPKVVGEELALKQIFMNLLSNAVKFTPAGGRITISFEVDTHGELRLSFTDTGVGLDDKEIVKALSPFGQVDNALSRSGSGTGLGLTLVNSLIKMHGGRFDLFSQKGIGTTATVVFPVDRISVVTDERIEKGQNEFDIDNSGKLELSENSGTLDSL